VSHFKIGLLAFLLAAFLLICAGAQAQPNPGKLVFHDTSSRILTINGDGTGQTLLTQGGSIRDANAEFSRDGGRVAFDRNISFHTNIFVMNSDGTNPVSVTTNTDMVANSDPSWSPDGTKLAFVSNRSGQGKVEIWVVNVDGTGLARLTSAVQIGTSLGNPIYSSDLSPSWSPDGTRIAFSSNREGIANREIYVMNADGSNQIRLTNTANDETNPTWSPDSQRLGFHINGGPNFGINIMNSDGTNLIHVTNAGFSPAWSPDGTKFAFAGFDAGNNFRTALYLINVNGSNLVRITNNSFDCSAPAWAPSSSSPIPTSTISGHVLDGSGNPVNGATLNLTGTLTRSVQSDAAGAYAFAGLPVGNYQINIVKSGFGFIPTSVNFNNLTANQTANFTAYVAYSISGNVSGLAGNSILVNLSGSQSRSVLTDFNGNYSFDILPAGGNYSVAINNPIWNITPTGYSFNNLSANQTANFNAVRATYTISGRITRLGNPKPGVTVELHNSTGNPPITRTTDANGQYSFTGILAGTSALIRPVAANSLFEPQSLTFNPLDGNKTADFVALSTNHLVFTTRYVFAGEGQCNLLLTVARGGNAQGVGPITVQYATADGTATAGSDYTAVSGVLNFPEGTNQQTITIPFLADQVPENPETFSVNLTNPIGEVDLGNPSSVTVVLTDPAPPTALVLATESNSDRAVALNATNLLAGPFKTSTPYNFSSDTRTRVSFFVSGVQFNACQGTNALSFEARDSQQHLEISTVEAVSKLPGANPYLQMNVIVPQGLLHGDLMIRFMLGNLASNQARITTQP
jgi:Tol biopolymer transport system component